MRDEGAANHMRLGTSESTPGVHVFVYGDKSPKPQTHWPRQTLAACQTIARQHRLPSENTFFLKQHPQAIDAGAFHNDVVAASHHGLLLHHELAFYQGDGVLKSIEQRYEQLHNRKLARMEVRQSDLSIDDAITTYLFNSQIVSPSHDDPPVIICPSQVEEKPAAKEIVDQWCEAKLFSDAQFVDLRQSMAGGGGPACLRLRVPLTEIELQLMPTQSRWTRDLHEELRSTIEKHYPDSLRFADLSNIDFVSKAVEAQRRVANQLLGQA